MNSMTMHLGIPSHAVAPAVLAQRLTQCDQVLQQCELISIKQTTLQANADTVAIYAVQLHIERSHITLQHFSALDQAALLGLQSDCLQWCTQDIQGLVFTPSVTKQDTLLACVGTLNMQLDLPNPATLIGRDIALALPRHEVAKPLRQLFNVSQMHLFTTPLVTRGLVALPAVPAHGPEQAPSSGFNSLWFCPVLSTERLTQKYLQLGLNGWWDAVEHWDYENAADLSALIKHSSTQQPIKLTLQFADQSLELMVCKRSNWAIWRSTTRLLTILNALT